MRRVYIAAFRGRDLLHPTDRKHSVQGRSVQRMEINLERTCNALTSVGKDNMLYIEYD